MAGAILGLHRNTKAITKDIYLYITLETGIFLKSFSCAESSGGWSYIKLAK